MKTVFSTIATAALALVPAIANAQPTEPVTLKYKGSTYVYTVEQVGSSRVLRGALESGRAPFRLVVGKRRVRGMVNGSEVSFLLSSIKPVKGIVVVERLAAR
jgi:hypothetical protein